MAFKLKCPSCRGSFAWSPKEGMPDLCALCGEKVGHDTDDDIVFCPAIRTNAKTRSVDDVYRQMEAGSITRAQIAASMTNSPVSEMSSLKITNMRDNQKQGDTAVTLQSSPVTELMAAAPQQFGFQGGNGLGFSGPVSTGPHPNAGARMRTALQNMHDDGRGNGAVISDRPALETMQAGYRRRG